MTSVRAVGLCLSALTMAPAGSQPNFAQQFQHPPAWARILRINHGWSSDAAAREAYVATIGQGGFGGAVTNVSFGDGYVTNPANWDALRSGILAMQAAGLEMWLYDEAGYPSGRAGGLVLDGHPEREARALLATTARIDVDPDGACNVAARALATASSTDSAGGVYAAGNVNDGNVDTSDWRHWSNDPAQPPSPGAPQWVALEWNLPHTVKRIAVATMEGYEVQDYVVEYWDGDGWALFGDAAVRGNTASRREHASPTPVRTDRLRFAATRGSRRQPGIARLVELEAIALPGDCDPGATCSLAMPPGERLLARAYPEAAGGGIALDGAVELPAAESDRIAWSAPPGRWRLVAVTIDRLFEGSQVDFSGVPEHAPYVSLLDPDAVGAFLEITHEAYARELGGDLGSLFVATFTDEPSLIASYYARAMPWAPIAWHPLLRGRFEERTGQSLDDHLPLLFVDGPGQESVRYEFWRATASQLRENYFLRLREWCAAHGIPSGGHLLLEEDIRFHVSLYGDFFACLREMDVPGIDVLSCDPAVAPWRTARLASSACELEGGALVMSETSDFIEMWADPPQPVSLEEFRGTVNRLLLGGVNRFNTYSQFRGLSPDDTRALNEWTGRGCLALTGGQRNSAIAVVYPIETAWTRFHPSRQGLHESGAASARLATTIARVDALLYESQREFGFVDSRTLVDAGCAEGELRQAALAAPVVILPDTDTLPIDAWRRLERFWEAGGVVIAAGARPRNSDLEFPSAEAEAIGVRLLGATEDLTLASSATNAEGGIGVYLPEGRLSELPGLLDRVLTRDLTVDQPGAPVRIARRAIDGKDVFLVINDGPDPWTGAVSFGPSAASGERLDLATGEITPLSEPSRVELALDRWGATILRFDAVTRVQRLRPSVLGL